MSTQISRDGRRDESVRPVGKETHQEEQKGIQSGADVTKFSIEK